MTELANAFTMTTILSGNNAKPLNVLQVQRLLESNIKNCQVIGVVPKANCTLIRLTVSEQTFDFAVAPNTVACKSTTGNMSVDYNGVLTETILTIVNEFITPEPQPKTAGETVLDKVYEDKLAELRKKAICSNSKYVGFAEITNRKFWRELTEEVLKRIPENATDEQIIGTFCELMDKRLFKRR